MSSLSSSALGLTDSPLRPRLRSVVPSTSSSSIPGTPIRNKASQPQLRQAASRNSLHQEATTNAARKVFQQQSMESLRPTPPRPSPTANNPNTSRPASRTGLTTTTNAAPPRPATSAAKSVSPAQTGPRTTVTPTHPVPGNATARPAQPPRAQNAGLSRPTPKQPTPIRRKPPPASPARTDITLAEEWESELIKDTRQLNIRSAPLTSMRQGPTAKEREEQRLKDIEWERSGLWETERDPAREAEDRVRRDIGRDVAYPPATPRVPVRAAPTGVTSIHIGVRPRLHPTRASDSMIRNQPDPTVPLPLFSPASANTDLPGESARGSYPSKYDPAIAEKARKEYEDWKAKKEEREGGIADGDTYGTRDWVPKDRQVARPGNVEGIAHSDTYEENHHRRVNQDQLLLEQQMLTMQQQAMQAQRAIKNNPSQNAQQQGQSPKPKDVTQVQAEIDSKPVQETDLQAQYQNHNWGYPYPYNMGYEGMGGQMQSMEGYYPDQAYWDPSYWWGMNMGMMGDPHPQQMTIPHAEGSDGKKVQFLDPNSNSGSVHEGSPHQAASTPVTPEDPYADM